ncbi:LysR substrate-binding domain-containing protein [Cryptosporangium aurantiacum]|uniref:Transcriptional regulator, LysR family n=1 Tax=Cryptosporangium aurantiacum TaxID=134849 RepID=A0A1M7RM89_9ACTN|nr:LysR substrate-binding domain-containing protein [Cryptosporangium aurantiacum]SHN47309.1 transcriptional regulator, LysR family [Cryptosporangium aurantiacum]
MELRQLQYFITTAQELHFGRAARSMHITQPSLTQQIQRLEADLGVRLFDRNSHHVQLTEAGEVLLVKAQRVIRQARKAEQAAQHSDRRDACRGSARPLHIGFNCPAATRLLPRALRAFWRRYPEADVVLHDLWTAQQVDAVLTGDLDLGFVFGPVRDTGLRTRVVLREPLVALLPAGHRLAEGSLVSMSALAREPQVFFDRELSPAVHNQVHRTARNVGANPDIRHAVSHPSAIPVMVAAGHAVALASAARAARSSSPGVVTRGLAGEGVTVDVVMVWRSEAGSGLLDTMIDAVDAVTDRRDAA